MRVSVRAMTVSPVVFCERFSLTYRHRYRQFFRLQGTTQECSRASVETFLSVFQCPANESERMRTIANGSMAGAGGFEPPHGGIKIRCLTAWLRPMLLLSQIAAHGGRTIMRGETSRNRCWQDVRSRQRHA